MAASIEKKLAIVITATSRFAMWVSSCASTPSISWGSSRFMRPCVTATTACFWFRPVANAFGTSVGMTATRGFGQVGHRREALDHRVQLRRLVRRHDLRARREQCDLVRREVLERTRARP